MTRHLVTTCIAWLALSCGPIDQSGHSGSADSGVGNNPPEATEIRIVTPADGQSCQADDHDDCAVSVAVMGAIVAPRGACEGRQHCGHLELFIDGDACGSPNTESGSDDFLAHFARCAKAEGMHTLTCELRDDMRTLIASSGDVRIRVERKQHDDNGGEDGPGHDDGDDHGGDQGGPG
jgi:hypothetical protein